MKISTKGKYGLIAMVDLAAHEQDGHVSLASLSTRQQISESYLGQIFAALRRANLVGSIKGAEGGYYLARRPEEITAGEVLEVLEGTIDVMSDAYAQRYGKMNGQALLNKCLQDQLWNRLNDCILDVIHQVTLKDLAERYNEMQEPEPFIYMI